MNILNRYKSLMIAALLILFLAELSAFSQDTLSSDTSRNKFYAGISFGLTQNSLITGSTPTLEGLTSTSSNSFNILLETGYFFSKHFGISTGIGYETYRNELSLNSYTDSFPSVDLDNESYERRVSGSEILEDQDISMLNIPLSLIFRIPFLKRAGFFVSAGINLSLPIEKKYSSSGTYTFTGYYSSYNVLFHDLPEYGFSANTASYTDGGLDLEAYIIDATAGAGIQYSISRNLQFAIGVNYKRSITNISEPEAAESFQLSSDIDQINSIVSGLSSSKIETIDLRFSLRYYFR